MQININKNKLEGVVFITDDVTIPFVKKIWKSFITDGLSKLKIFAHKNIDESVYNFVNENYKDKIEFLKINELN